jgi:hypothetical protein
MDRRKFLIGLFGTAAIAAAGPLPAVLEAMPEEQFKEIFRSAGKAMKEIYLTPDGDYMFAKITYLLQEPWVTIEIPEDAKPLKAESDRIAEEQIARMKREFGA